MIITPGNFSTKTAEVQSHTEAQSLREESHLTGNDFFAQRFIERQTFELRERISNLITQFDASAVLSIQTSEETVSDVETTYLLFDKIQELRGIQELGTELTKIRGAALILASLNDELQISDDDFGFSDDDYVEFSCDSDTKKETPLSEKKTATKINNDIKDARKPLDDFINNIVRNYGELLSIKPDFFMAWMGLYGVDVNKRSSTLAFMEQQILMRCFNKITYNHWVRDIIGKEKGNIFNSFYHGALQLSDLMKADVIVRPGDDETHNNGQITCKIGFVIKGINQFSVYFKPRSAEIDARIIQVFGALNDHVKAEGLQAGLLPVYTIRNMTHFGQSVSLWEFVPGEHHEGAANIAIKNINSTLQASLKAQLQRLESVFQILNVSDQHSGNLLYSPTTTGGLTIVPIDLENVQPGNPTGLYAGPHPTIAIQDETEKSLLQQCKADIQNYPTRVVPIDTKDFLGHMTSYNAVEKLALSIQVGLQAQGFQLMISIEKLYTLLLQDLISYDVPYFSKQGADLYYGLCTSNIKIGRMGHVQVSESKSERV